MIPDPADDPAANAKKCVECEEELAARYCNECDDAYCANCFDNTHAAGKRAYHNWDPIGPQRCMECEKEVATRWCTNCDDPYCESCFKTIHSKGKRAKHEWTPIGDGPPENADEDVDEAGATSGYEDFMAAKAKQEKGNGKSIMMTIHQQFTGITRQLESRRMLTHLKRRVENTASQMAMVRICKTRVMTLLKPRTSG